MTLDEIITALRVERELRGWSYRDVQEAGGPSYVMVWNYERGEKKPSIAQLAKWADVLGYVLVTELAIKPVPDPPSRES